VVAEIYPRLLAIQDAGSRGMAPGTVAVAPSPGVRARAREAQMSCFWEEYQADQTFPKMTRWLKHRAYIRIMRQCGGDRREAQGLYTYLS